MTWRLARSLVTLRAQIDDMAPERSRASDGTIGDPAHAARVSDHNPDAGGVVRALDITHDPAHGVDCGVLAEALIAGRDPRIKYLIWNRRICSATVAPWTWRTYTGTNPHTLHLHLSVVDDALADDPTPWLVATIPPDATGMSVERLPVLRRGSAGDDVKRAQRLLNEHGAGLKVDGDFGPLTEAAVRRFQRAHGLVADGIVGPYTWNALT